MNTACSSQILFADFQALNLGFSVTENTFSLQINEDTGTIRPIQRRPGPGENASTTSKEKEKSEDERIVMFQKETELGSSFVQSLIRVVYDVYYSSVGPAVKHKCLSAVLKMLYHSPEELLKNVLDRLPISSYIAGMLSSKDLRVVCSALQKADILMKKLPELFHVYFRREGVMHRTKSLSEKNYGQFTSPDRPIDCKGVPTKVIENASATGRLDDNIDALVIEMPTSSSGGRWVVIHIMLQ